MAFYRNPYPTLSTPTPPDHAAVINARLAATGICLLDPGEYEIDDPILMPTGSRLEPSGPGRVVFTPTWAPDVGDADLRTNLVISVESTMSGTTTTLSATMKCGSRTLTLTSTTGLTAGDWLYLSGSNAASDELLMSDGASVRVRELVQIATVDSGTVVTLKSRTRQHHATGKSVTKVATLVENVTIRGISIRAPGGTIACGIVATAARNVRIEDYEIEGLSRAGVDHLGCDGVYVRRLYSHGECNAWIRGESSIHVVQEALSCDSQGLREHANGKPKAQVDLRGRCKFVRTRNAHFARGNFGYRDWGCHFAVLENSSCEDMDATAALARDTEFTAGSNLAGGLAWDGGAGDVATWAAFGIGAAIVNYSVDVASMRSGGVYSATEPRVTIYLHDHFQMRVQGLHIGNRGSAYETTPDGWVSGMDIRDATGSMSDVLISGCYAAISTRNVYARFKATNVTLDGVAGSSTSASWGYVMGAAGGLGSEVEFNGLSFANFNATEFEVGPEVTTAVTDWNLNWRNVNCDGYRAEYVTLARNDSGTPFTIGQIGMYDDAASAATGATARMVDTPTANARGVGVIIRQDGSGLWCLFAPLPQMVSAGVTGAVAIGGMLAATTNRDLVSTATLADACARATRKLTATGVILVGGV